MKRNNEEIANMVINKHFKSSRYTDIAELIEIGLEYYQGKRKLPNDERLYKKLPF